MEAGEEVAISRLGAVVARLVPAAAPAAEPAVAVAITAPPEPAPAAGRRVDWTQSAAFLRDRTGERVLSAEESLALIKDAGGRYQQVPMPNALVVCVDTSFLFSPYGNDVNTPVALVETGRLGGPLALTALNGFELENALRPAEFRRALAPGKAAAHLADYEGDKAAGQLVFPPCDLAAVLAEARRPSAAHTRTGGHRAFGVLHVAAAVHLGAGGFRSFDANQRALAAAMGLTVRP